MEIQFLTISILDRPAKGVLDATQETWTDPRFPLDEQGVSLSNIPTGCTVYIFGRTASGTSVACLIHGWMPCLYFKVESNGSRKMCADMKINENLTSTHSFSHLYGYEPDENAPSKRKQHTYLKVNYPSMQAWREARNKYTQDGAQYKAHEGHVEPTLRFLSDANLIPSMWYKIKTFDKTSLRSTTCQEEIEVALDDIIPIHEERPDAPYVRLFWDIETLGLDPLQSEAIQISLHAVQGEKERKVVVALGTVSPQPGFEIVSCQNERELLEEFRRLVLEMDPDFTVTYNGSFDHNFLWKRAELVKSDAFRYLSRLLLKPCRLHELQSATAQKGETLLNFKYIVMAGRSNLDWFLKLKDDCKGEPTYKLDHFAKKEFGAEEGKHEMDYREIPILQSGSNEDRARLARYCMQDSTLLYRLDERRNMTSEVLQYAGVYRVLPEWVYYRGQQVRITSQLLPAARTYESVPMLLNTPQGGFIGHDFEGKFQGATVCDPLRGYYQKPVFVWDYKSLYPSTMVAHNLCFSTYILDPDYSSAKGVTEHPTGACFVGRRTHKGLLPTIIERLLQERSKAKKEIKKNKIAAAEFDEGHPCHKHHVNMSNLFDGRQLALKSSVNSWYGATGAVSTGVYYNLDISRTVTYHGRNALEISKAVFNEHYPGFKLIYGDTDSLMGTLPNVEDVSQAYEVGNEAAKLVTEKFEQLDQKPMELEFEKVYDPYLLEDKKRYAGNKYEPGNGRMVLKGVECKGLETEKKSTMKLVKDVMNDVFEELLTRKDPRSAFACFKSFTDKMINDEFPLDAYILQKDLSSKAEAKADNFAQARVNELRRQRNPGSEVAKGTASTWVVINGHKKERATLLAEDPDYAREHNLKINRWWYFKHHVRNVFAKVFMHIQIDQKSVPYDALCDQVLAKLDAQRLGARPGGLDMLFAKRPREE